MWTEDDFQRALDANPDDHNARLVFADWLDERDDPRGPGYRALGILQRVPRHWRGESEWVYGWLKAPHWDRSGRGQHKLDIRGLRKYKPPVHVLPEYWMKKGGEQSGTGYIFRRATRREIEDAAALAFSKLTARRRAELLAVQTAG